MSKTAVAVICYKRPEYLERCLKALAENSEIAAGMPVYFFCSGGPDAAQAENQCLIKNSGIPNRTLILHSTNLGVSATWNLVKDMLFDLDHDRVVLLEEDVVVSRHYIGVMERGLSWLEKNYSNVGVLSASVRCSIPRESGSSILRPLTREEKFKNLGLLSDGGASLCNHIISRDAWSLIAEDMRKYARQFDARPGVLDEPGAQAWMHSLVPQLGRPRTGSNPFPVSWDPATCFSVPNVCCSCDAAMDLLLRCAGQARAGTWVNRALDIGAKGAHATEEWHRKEFGDTRLDEFEEDRDLVDFTTKCVNFLAKPE